MFNYIGDNCNSTQINYRLKTRKSIGFNKVINIAVLQLLQLLQYVFYQVLLTTLGFHGVIDETRLGAAERSSLLYNEYGLATHLNPSQADW